MKIPVFRRRRGFFYCKRILYVITKWWSILRLSTGYPWDIYGVSTALTRPKITIRQSDSPEYLTIPVLHWRKYLL